MLYLSVGGLTNLAVAQGTTCLFTRTSGGGLEALAVELAERQRLTLEHARAWLEHVGLDQPLEDIDGDPAIVAEARSVLADGSAAHRRRGPQLAGLPPRAGRRRRASSRVVLTGPRGRRARPPRSPRRRARPARDQRRGLGGPEGVERRAHHRRRRPGRSRRRPHEGRQPHPRGRAPWRRPGQRAHAAPASTSSSARWAPSWSCWPWRCWRASHVDAKRADLAQARVPRPRSTSARSPAWPASPSSPPCVRSA